MRLTSVPASPLRRSAAAAQPVLPARPGAGLAIVTCMDARIEPLQVLGLQRGDAHVIRNAGGLVTDDVVRSLTVSQRLLGTVHVIVMQHTDCGLMTVSDEAFQRALKNDTGCTPPWAVGAFDDLVDSVRRGMRTVLDTPFLPAKRHVRGFVLDVGSGQVAEVDCRPAATPSERHQRSSP
jgi:carbonic anhydrase